MFLSSCASVRVRQTQAIIGCDGLFRNVRVLHTRVPSKRGVRSVSRLLVQCMRVCAYAHVCVRGHALAVTF